MQCYKTLKGYVKTDCRGVPNLCSFTNDISKSGNIEWTYIEVKYNVCESSPENEGLEMIDYNYNLTLQQVGSTVYYKTRKSFISGSTRVYLDGVRMTPNDGSNDTYDYVESGNTKIKMVRTIPPNSNLTIEYNTIN